MDDLYEWFCSSFQYHIFSFSQFDTKHLYVHCSNARFVIFHELKMAYRMQHTMVRKCENKYHKRI